MLLQPQQSQQLVQLLMLEQPQRLQLPPGLYSLQVLLKHSSPSLRGSLVMLQLEASLGSFLMLQELTTSLIRQLSSMA